MSKVQKYTLPWNGKELIIEVGQFAQQAMGSCTVRYGDTVVLATATCGKQPREGIDYFPLMVDYQERFYAAGKISGSRFIKREGRPSDEAVLMARLIDRALRPLFDESIRVDVQVIVTVFCIDEDNDPDVPAFIAAVCALMISNIPWHGPLGAARVGIADGKYVINPSYKERETLDMEIFVSGTGTEVMMLEAGGKEVEEKIVNDGIEEGLKAIAPVIDFLNLIQSKAGIQKLDLNPENFFEKEEIATRNDLKKSVLSFIQDKIHDLVFTPNKIEQVTKIASAKKEIVDHLEANGHEDAKDYAHFIDGVIDEALNLEVRKLGLESGKRPDGRAFDEIRSLSALVGVFPRTHGSAVFNRGETQVVSIVTLGAPGDEQTLDGMEISGKKRYMHHYNMPPFSVGEVKPLRGVNRREIGHGALAEKALIPVLPPKEIFPYTIRVVSEVLSSNGSTSQASVCGSTLSLMDAGVPITRPVAGISMGLMIDPQNKKNYKILTDIQGLEDHAGYMDFKVAGTEKGITAIQLDIKLDGIPMEIVRETIGSARDVRMKILEVMKRAIVEPRKELSRYAPRIETLRIDPEKIGDLIGPAGKVINKIIDETGVSIDIEDDGLVLITSTEPEGMKKALELVKAITKEVIAGEIYEGKVTQIVRDRMRGSEIGAIVQITPNQDGMVHISQLALERVNKISDVVKLGDTIKVQVVEIDKERGRISLSRKALLMKERKR